MVNPGCLVPESTTFHNHSTDPCVHRPQGKLQFTFCKIEPLIANEKVSFEIMFCTFVQPEGILRVETLRTGYLCLINLNIQVSLKNKLNQSAAEDLEMLISAAYRLTTSRCGGAFL